MKGLLAFRIWLKKLSLFCGNAGDICDIRKDSLVDLLVSSKIVGLGLCFCIFVVMPIKFRIDCYSKICIHEGLNSHLFRSFESRVTC